ncbi:MAG: RNA polymerase sigma-70 factor [Marinilabiliales bacterium]|nr:RNA polymerase sigma-70 factor [Marinilabiliales bacterium]
MSFPDDPIRFEAIRNDEEGAFEKLFRENYRPLTAYAFRFVTDLAIAENIVQDVFLKLWQNRHQLIITTSLMHYLFRSVRNHCLNQLDKNKVRAGYLKACLEREEETSDYHEFYPEIGLIEKIEKAISALPEKRQEIFRLAREEGLKYKEIAERLNLSVKTVEAQMTLALKQLRESLKEYHHLVLFFYFPHRGKIT